MKKKSILTDFFLYADFFYTYFLKTQVSAVFMSVDPRERFSSGPIVTSQLCVAEKLLKKSKTKCRPQSSFRFTKPGLVVHGCTFQFSCRWLFSVVFSVFSSPFVLFNSVVVGRPQSSFSIQSSLIVNSRPQSYFQFSRPRLYFSIQSSLVVLSRLFSLVVLGRFWSSPVIFF